MYVFFFFLSSSGMLLQSEMFSLGLMVSLSIFSQNFLHSILVS